MESLSGLFAWNPALGVARRMALLAGLATALCANGADLSATTPSPSATTASTAIALSAEQLRRLGMETAAPRAEKGLALARLPGVVTVPTTQQAIVSSTLAGVVERIAVAPHQAVKRGQLLALLRSPALADAQRSYIEASVQAQLAEQSLKRDSQLRVDGIIAESRFLATQSVAEREAATLALRRQELRLSGMSEEAISELARTRRIDSALALVAPRDGVLMEALPAPGQRLEPGVPAFHIARLDPLWVEIQANVEIASRLKPGASVRIAAAQASGRLLSIGRSVDAQSATVPLRAEITQGAGRLFANQPVEVEIAMGGTAPAWAVPTAALSRQGAIVNVFARTPAGFRPVRVSVLQESRDEALVTGLTGQEQVAVKGVSQLKSLSAAP